MIYVLWQSIEVRLGSKFLTTAELSNIICDDDRKVRMAAEDYMVNECDLCSLFKIAIERTANKDVTRAIVKFGIVYDGEHMYAARKDICNYTSRLNAAMRFVLETFFKQPADMRSDVFDDDNLLIVFDNYKRTMSRYLRDERDFGQESNAEACLSLLKNSISYGSGAAFQPERKLRSWVRACNNVVDGYMEQCMSNCAGGGTLFSIAVRCFFVNAWREYAAALDVDNLLLYKDKPCSDTYNNCQSDVQKGMALEKIIKDSVSGVRMVTFGMGYDAVYARLVFEAPSSECIDDIMYIAAHRVGRIVQAFMGVCVYDSDVLAGSAKASGGRIENLCEYMTYVLFGPTVPYSHYENVELMAAERMKLDELLEGYEKREY